MRTNIFQYLGQNLRLLFTITSIKFIRGVRETRNRIRYKTKTNAFYVQKDKLDRFGFRNVRSSMFRLSGSRATESFEILPRTTVLRFPVKTKEKLIRWKR